MVKFKVKGDAMHSNAEKLDLMDNILSRNINWINTADAKAGFVFLVTTSMLGVIAVLCPSVEELNLTALACSVVALICLCLSIFYLFFVNFPQTDAVKKSLVFFGCISKIEESRYTQKILMGITTEVLEDMAEQCHATAKIATYKFKNLKTSFKFLFFAILPWLASVFLLYPIHKI